MIIYGALEKNLLGVSDIVHFKRIPISTWILAVQTPRKGFSPPKKIHKINEYEHVFRRDTNFLSEHIIKYLFQHCGFWICPWHCERVNFLSLYMHQKIDCCISLWIIHCTVLQHVSGIQRILLLLRMNHHKLHILHELSGAKRRGVAASDSCPLSQSIRLVRENYICESEISSPSATRLLLISPLLNSHYHFFKIIFTFGKFKLWSWDTVTMDTNEIKREAERHGCCRQNVFCVPREPWAHPGVLISIKINWSIDLQLW